MALSDKLDILEQCVNDVEEGIYERWSKTRRDEAMLRMFGTTHLTSSTDEDSDTYDDDSDRVGVTYEVDVDDDYDEDGTIHKKRKHHKKHTTNEEADEEELADLNPKEKQEVLQEDKEY